MKSGRPPAPAWALGGKQSLVALTVFKGEAPEKEDREDSARGALGQRGGHRSDSRRAQMW